MTKFSTQTTQDKAHPFGRLGKFVQTELCPEAQKSDCAELGRCQRLQEHGLDWEPPPDEAGPRSSTQSSAPGTTPGAWVQSCAFVPFTDLEADEADAELPVKLGADYRVSLAEELAGPGAQVSTRR